MSIPTKLQLVLLELSDGSTYTFTGPALPEDEKIEIVKIKMSKPMDMPNGFSISRISDDFLK